MRALSRHLGTLGRVIRGPVQDRGHGPGGPACPWTRKEKGKTVSVALSREPYEAMKQSSENGKAPKDIQRGMAILSRREIFTNLPGVKRRNPSSCKMLGLVQSAFGSVPVMEGPGKAASAVFEIVWPYCRCGVGADRRAARKDDGWKTARPAVGPYRSAATLFCKPL